MVSKEDIIQAKKISIIDIAKINGIDLIQTGGAYFKGVEHNSLVINSDKNVFSWNSQNLSGSSIDFVMKVIGSSSLPEAVKYLISPELNAKKIETTERKKEPFSYYFKNNNNFKQAFDYLTLDRGLKPSLITMLHNKGFIQEDINHNAIFVWSANGNRVGASVQGTVVDRKKFEKHGAFKQIAKNSAKDFGFNMTIGAPKKVLIFEAPIDLLSYYSLHPNIKDTMLFSMDGLKPESVNKAIEYAYRRYSKIPEHVGFAIDNDAGAHIFFDKLINEHQLVIKETGEVLPFVSVIPKDRSIPISHQQILNKIAENRGINWLDLAALEKAETNFSSQRELANGFDFNSGFINGKVNEPWTKDVYSTRADELAVLIKSSSFKGETDFTQLVKLLQPDLEEKMLKPFVHKIESYRRQYEEVGFSPVKMKLKDWNDILKSKQLSVLEPKLLESTFSNDQEKKSISIEKSINSDGSERFKAINQLDNGVGYFEADSAHEMAYLIKTYGYNSVDKQDERVLSNNKNKSASNKQGVEEVLEATR